MTRLTLAVLLLALAAACCCTQAVAADEPATDQVAAPAEPTPALREFFGDDLLTDKGKKADLSELNGKIIAIYFSASWCPPCRAFSPRLVDLAKKLQSQGKPFAVVLVGRDESERKALDYMKSHKMTGYLIPPEADSNRTLRKRYHVSGIPYLVIVDDTGKTLDSSARATVQSRSGEAWKIWTGEDAIPETTSSVDAPVIF